MFENPLDLEILSDNCTISCDKGLKSEKSQPIKDWQKDTILSSDIYHKAAHSMHCYYQRTEPVSLLHQILMNKLMHP